jgi:hypothetical protein
MKPKSITTKLLTILISILLVIQPLSGCIADFSFDSLNSKNKNLSKEQKESLQKALTVSSLIDAKTVNLQTNTGVIIKGSQIQATTVNFMANFLNLISDKNSESYSSFSDSSGVLTRTIINQGYVKETAVDAKVDAQKITLNGKILLEDKLKPENLLKQLSSEYNLNEAQISQVKAELTNKEWYDKTTTLSQMGMIIVQATAMVLTYGTLGSAISGISGNIVTNATAQTMVNAAISSMTSQLIAQLATAAITGNKIELDVNTLLTNSLKAAALAGLTAQIDTNLGLDKDNLSFAEKSTKQILHGIATKAVYGGNLESILATSVGNVAFDYIGHSVYSNDSQFPELRDAIPKTVIHSLVGGTLAELTGGDFSQGAINTAVSHTVAEYMDKELLDKTVKGDISKEEAKAYIKAISSVVSGAAVLATHEKVSDKDLKIAQDMGTSVVENNALKGFDAKVEFAKGIYQGSSEKVWEDLKNLKIALDNPKETIKALMNLVATPEALAILGEDVVNDLKLKSVNIYNALISDIDYQGEKANQAGRDLGELAFTVLEAYSGVKGVTTGVNAAKDVIKAVGTKADKVINDTVDLNMKFITLNGSSVELASVGSKGNWDKLVNKDLKPNTAYQLDNGHTYITNASGKVNYVEADLSKITMPRNTYQQSVVGKSGEAADQGGHLIASALGGAGDKINLVPMDKVLNNGEWKQMENTLKKALENGQNVSMKIDLKYPSSSDVRPSNFTVQTTINGEKEIWRFEQ